MPTGSGDLTKPSLASCDTIENDLLEAQLALLNALDMFSDITISVHELAMLDSVA